jgi:phosphatidate cytidylyltransferase
MLFGTAAGLLAARLLLPPGWGTGSQWAGAAVFSAVLAAAGQLGDLVESAFKRWAGVKDSGRLVPEFGGVLDMIDGFLVSVPVAYLFLKAGGEKWIFGF